MRSRWHLYAFLCPGALAALVLALVACGRTAEKPAGNSAQPPPDAGTSVTPVSGPSWLTHLGISDDMGRMGGDMPPPRSARVEPGLTDNTAAPEGMGGMMRKIYPMIRSGRERLDDLMNESFELTGSDLYRLNCQSCHGPDGMGSPPEIKSLIGPVQGTSAAFVAERMNRMGRPISAAMARDLAANADSILRERLQKGGEKMPPFEHLRGDEVNALIQSLQELADVSSGKRKEMLVPQSVARVGEHLVKGTCHTCHDATGPGGGRMAMMQGIIPSLASMPEQQSLQSVVRQVREGSSPMMSMMGGPVMPALPYITEDEAAAAYLFLMEYPPVGGR